MDLRAVLEDDVDGDDSVGCSAGSSVTARAQASWVLIRFGRFIFVLNSEFAEPVESGNQMGVFGCRQVDNEAGIPARALFLRLRERGR